MILGVDHIALSSESRAAFEAELSALKDGRMAVRFVEKDLPNSPTKKPYLSHYEETHDVAYLQPFSGIAIELTSHGSRTPDADAGYQAVFDRMPAGSSPRASAVSSADEIWKSFGFGDVKPARWNGAPIWHAANLPTTPPDGLSILAVLSPTHDLERSASFWTALGFKPESFGASWKRLKYASPLPRKSLDLALVQTGQPKGARLDSAGFPCLAFWTTDVAADCARLAAAGLSGTTEPSDHRVNGNELKLVFAKGPCGELVELIQVVRAGARSAR